MVRISADVDKRQHYDQWCLEADASGRADVESAADVCPMQAITVE